jgi:hypothetical protein
MITMTLYLEKENVMNTHELTNGLELKKGIAAKNGKFGYTQTLSEIAKILQDSHPQTTLVSRLAKYHIDGRKDPASDCINFYKFLNQHFGKKIMCVRENIFEYAMSWSIRNKSGVLNVYDKEDRTKVSQVSEVDENYFIQKCQQYVKYIEWVERNFPNVEKVSYENMIKNSDQVIENLTGHRNTFTHKVGHTLSSILMNEYKFLKKAQESDLTRDQLKSLARYRIICNQIISKDQMLGVPLKNTTLSDKKQQIRNFDICLDKFYKFAKNHNWIDQSKATFDFWIQEHVC